MQIIRLRMQLSVADLQWSFGLNPGHWSEFTKYPDRPVTDPATAILGRFLNEHKEANLIPPAPDLAKVHAFLNLGTHVSLKEFGLALGRHISAGHRWVSAGKEAPADIQRMIMVLSLYVAQTLHRDIEDCVTNGVNKYEQRMILDIWRDWRRLVEREANSRGIVNIWEERCWPTPEPKARRNNKGWEEDFLDEAGDIPPSIDDLHDHDEGDEH